MVYRNRSHSSHPSYRSLRHYGGQSWWGNSNDRHFYIAHHSSPDGYLVDTPLTTGYGLSLRDSGGSSGGSFAGFSSQQILLAAIVVVVIVLATKSQT